ncbi:hypothetical protein [Helicobacter felis]|uniref:hypothetical protein n=1 Tax=Helicobacter felis TaxID=214 RepID=UPI000CF0F6E8|nr:hypothetical protein [Helicobacter felis]
MKSLLKTQVVYPIGVCATHLSYRTTRAITAFEELILEVVSAKMPCTLEELSRVLAIDMVFLEESLDYLKRWEIFNNDGRNLGDLRPSEEGGHFLEKRKW